MTYISPNWTDELAPLCQIGLVLWDSIVVLRQPSITALKIPQFPAFDLFSSPSAVRYLRSILAEIYVGVVVVITNPILNLATADVHEVASVS